MSSPVRERLHTGNSPLQQSCFATVTRCGPRRPSNEELLCERYTRAIRGKSPRPSVTHGPASQHSLPCPEAYTRSSQRLTPYTYQPQAPFRICKGGLDTSIFERQGSARDHVKKLLREVCCDRTKGKQHGIYGVRTGPVVPPIGRG